MPSQNDQTTPRIPTGERAAQKRRAILAAARTVFMRDGFGVGLDVICAIEGRAQLRDCDSDADVIESSMHAKNGGWKKRP